MKIATVGKGGSGKTTIAGTLARVFSENDRNILAIDGDPNPNLALTLGLSRAQANKITYIPSSVMKRGEEVGGVVMMVPAISKDEIMKQFATQAAPNVELIVMGQPAHGTAGTGCMCASHRAIRGLIAELTAYGEHTVTDMEAGLEHLRRGTARHVDMMLVVVEPYYRSLEAGMRTAALAKELGIKYIKVVANKVRNDDDLSAINNFCDQHNMSLIGVVPYDEEMVAAERAEKSPYDYASQSAGINAIRTLAMHVDRLN